MSAKKSQEDNFFSEMDKKTSRRSCCTWQTLILFFAGVLAIAILLTIYLYHEIKKVDFSLHEVYPTTASQENFQKKLQLNPAENPTFSIAITVEDLDSIAANGIKTAPALEVKDIQFQIDQSQIIIYGKLNKPLKADLKMETIPRVSDDKINFKISKITAGKISLPNLLNSQIEQALNKLMDENFQPLYENYQVDKIELQNSQMVISGKLKK